MKRLSVVFLLFLLFGFSAAQERHNYLALGGELLEHEIGPFYFIAQGDSGNAYALASGLAESLGASLSFNQVSTSLNFRRGANQLEIAATSDIPYALAHRPQTLIVNGQSKDSFMAIIIDGKSYVPVTPIVEGLGGTSEFAPESLTLYIDMPSPTQASATPSAPQSFELQAPDVGVYDDFTRVALSIPEGTSYSIAVSAQQMLISLPEVTTSSYSATSLSAHLSSARYTVVDGVAALVIDTNYPLSASGQGYVIGLLPPTAERPFERLFVDFSPNRPGQQVNVLSTPITETVVQVSAPAPNSPSVNPTATQRVVVIDAGHGGRDPGTQGYASEEVVTLNIALKLKALLEQRGIGVVLTRDGDYSIKEGKSDDLLARAGLATPERNLFISIHVNGVNDGRAHGIETFVFGQPLNDALIALAIKENGGGAEGEALTREIQNNFDSIYQEFFREEQLSYSRTLAQAVQSRMVTATGARDRGVKENVLAVLRNARTPAVLVEVGFASNPNEGAMLNTDSYQNLLAQALADGVADFFNQGGSLAGNY